MKNKISPSLMCVDPFDFKDSFNQLEECGADFYHIDIMDGNFVPNLALGIDFVKFIRKRTKTPFDFHLMVQNPQKVVEFLDLKEGDLVSIHFESTLQIKEILENIKNKGSKAIVAINPSTSIDLIEKILLKIDGVNFMMVNPGFYGQRMDENILKKAKKFGEILQKLNLENFIFEVDGNITFQKAEILKNFGANLFVAGTSSIFSSNDLKSNFLKLKKCIE